VEERRVVGVLDVAVVFNITRLARLNQRLGYWKASQSQAKTIVKGFWDQDLDLDILGVEVLTDLVSFCS
jgi:hypothetical protein